MKNRWLATLTACLLTQYISSAHALETFIVKKIRIEGLQRISQETVYNYLPLHEGDELSEAKTPALLKALFDTGFFQDIQLIQDGNELVVKVIERPTIGKITISGNKDITDENLLSTLKTAGLSEGYVFDRATLEQVRNELEKIYFSHGKYGVKVETEVESKEHNRVNVAIKITEGQAARIKSVNIVGNQKFPTQVLLKTFTLRPTCLFSWISQSDQYDKQKLSADLEALRTYYLDRGYLNFQIVSTQVTITPDKQDIYVTINVEEGDQFTLDGFTLAGDTILPHDQLLPLVTLKEGEIFSRSKVAEIVTTLQNRLGQEGYAFAKVNPVPEMEQEAKKVRLTFFFEPGNKVYVRRVSFEGNSKTKDGVLRREVIQMESAPVNTKSIEESRTRLNRTGYFSEVKSDLRAVPGTTDQVDIVFTVAEASAGQLGGGVGYSDADGLLFNANITNRNFMGSGNSLDFNFNKSKAYTTYNVGYNNPYYTPEGISRGFNVFYTETDLGHATKIANYTTDAYGGNVTYGVPMSPVDRLTFGYGYLSTALEVGNPKPLEIIEFIQLHSARSQEANVSLGWSHNTLDRFIFPENGWSQSAVVTASVPGSHLQYFRMIASTLFYKSLGGGFIFNTGGTLGFGDGYGNTNQLPFYKNFFAGGMRTVRGYQENTLGPLDSLGQPFGGNFMATATAGIILPNFFAPDNKSIRIGLFVDGGQVYDLNHPESYNNPNVSRNPNGIRYSTGVSLTWMSPIAPLVFSIATPINKNNGDKTQVFGFNFGTSY
ncbi:MAG: outer membrane protein assembly factor BamA [Candidatus Berkiellales bacterium]